MNTSPLNSSTEVYVVCIRNRGLSMTWVGISCNRGVDVSSSFLPVAGRFKTTHSLYRVGWSFYHDKISSFHQRECFPGKTCVTSCRPLCQVLSFSPIPAMGRETALLQMDLEKKKTTREDPNSCTGPTLRHGGFKLKATSRKMNAPSTNTWY